MSCRSLLFAFGVAVAFPTSVLVQCLFEGKAYTGGATLQMVNGLHVYTDDGHGNFSWAAVPTKITVMRALWQCDQYGTLMKVDVTDLVKKLCDGTPLCTFTADKSDYGTAICNLPLQAQGLTVKIRCDVGGAVEVKSRGADSGNAVKLNCWP
jgi:hypothetical protein